MNQQGDHITGEINKAFDVREVYSDGTLFERMFCCFISESLSLYVNSEDLILENGF